MSEPAAAPVDLSRVLAEIAANAANVAHLAAMALEKTDDVTSLYALNTSIEIMACRMGWLADMAAYRLGLGEEPDWDLWLRTPERVAIKGDEGERHG